jgi:starvation-inducible outer membrane lipoprotein
MKAILGVLIVGLCMAFSACTSTSVFPPGIVQGVDQEFDFSRWRMMPNQFQHQKVQLGGRIVQSETKGEAVTLVVAQLPIVEHPAYGPRGTSKSRGEFAVVYPSRIESSFLQPGHHLMVIGMTQAPKVVAVDDLAKSLPSLTAICLHIWKTGGREIAEFPFNTGGGYEPLAEDTFCVQQPQ